MFDSDLNSGPASRKTSRRIFLVAAATLGGGLYFSYMGIFSKNTATAEAGPADKQPSGAPREVDIVEFTDSGERKETVHVPKVVKSENEWKQQLSPGAYNVTREEGTEMAFTGEYWNNHEQGIYRCVCCGNRWWRTILFLYGNFFKEISNRGSRHATETGCEPDAARRRHC